MSFKSGRGPVRVRLTCGCNIPMTLEPFRDNAKFSCPYGLGHGYNLGWVWAKSPDQSTPKMNPTASG